jgi:phosphomevalonate kinase
MITEKKQQQQQLSTIISTSAPGKALVCGGYLVLESPNIGLVLAVDSRFHSTVGFIDGGCNGKEEPQGLNTLLHNDFYYIKLDVYSPQFSSVLHYYLVYDTVSHGDSCHTANLPIQLIQRDRGSQQKQKDNPFIEKTLIVTFTFIRSAMSPSSFHNFVMSSLQGNKEAILALKLRADNDFYSQIPALRERQLELTSQNLLLLPEFLPPSLPVRKTGLGSSAALVTCLVGCLLRFFNLVVLPTRISCDDSNAAMDGEDEKTWLQQQQEGLRIVHNLSQICHCWAQGKIGSGFDVSSAIYGSQVYSRFNPDLLTELLAQHDLDNSSNNNDKGQQLVNLVQDTTRSLWNSNVVPLVLPKGIELIMADVCGGSESPSMAMKIMSWKKKAVELSSDTNAEIEVWNSLACVNEQIQQTLQELVDIEESLGDDAKQNSWNILKSLHVEQWISHASSNTDMATVSLLVQPLLKLRLLFLKARSLLKKMGEMAGVSVEPESQTLLANSTMEIPGVIAAGVPGAGGNDALFVLYIKGVDCDAEADNVVKDRIEQLWKDWSFSNGREQKEERGSTIVVCPLRVRHVRFGHGLIETDLAW